MAGRAANAVLLLLSVTCWVPAAKAQPPDQAPSRSNVGPQAPQATRESEREPGEMQKPADVDDSFLGFFEGMDTLAPRRRANRPADLPKITTISPFVAEPEPGEFPEEVQFSERELAPRNWELSSFAWEASNLHHEELYFEDVGLERYGHSLGIFQPIMSAVRFQAGVYTLPYRILVRPPCRCEYTLGYYRPGDYAPRLFYRLLPACCIGRRPERHFHVVHPVSDAAIPPDGIVESERLVIDPNATPAREGASPPNAENAQNLGAENTTLETGDDEVQAPY